MLFKGWFVTLTLLALLMPFQAQKPNEVIQNGEFVVAWDPPNGRHIGQNDLPKSWERELLITTELSNLQHYELLPKREGHTSWLQFRSTAFFEALLASVRLTDFQMWTTDWYSSMFGVGRTLDYINSLPEYKTYKEATEYRGPRWNNDNRVSLPVGGTVLAARWDVRLKEDAELNYPMPSSYKIAKALYRVKDPEFYFKGSEDKAVEVLENKFVKETPPVCHRQARVVFLLDPYGYTGPEVQWIGKIFGQVYRQLSRKEVTIRGASTLEVGAIPEGAAFKDQTRWITDGSVKHIDPLDLVEQGIADLKKGGPDNGAVQVLILVSRLKGHKADVPRAKRLWEEMDKVDIEPFFIGAHAWDRNDGNPGNNPYLPSTPPDHPDILALLNNESYRGWYITLSRWQIVSRRLVRMICEASVTLKEDTLRSFALKDNSTNSIYDRVYLRDKRGYSGKGRFVRIKCLSAPSCSFSVFAHPFIKPNEYLHGTRAWANIKFSETVLWDLHRSSDFVVHLSLVASGATELGIRGELVALN